MWTRGSSTILFLQDTGADEDHDLYPVKLGNGELKEEDMTPFKGISFTSGIFVTRVGIPGRKTNGHWFIEHKTRLNTGIIALNKLDNRRHDLYRVDLAQNVLIDEVHAVGAAAVTQPTGWWSFKFATLRRMHGKPSPEAPRSTRFCSLRGMTLPVASFKCAVDIVGPSNLKTLLATILPYWDAYASVFHARMGHLEHDSDLLDDASPVSESEQMIVNAIEKSGVSVYDVLYEGEGHGSTRSVNRVDHKQKIDAFLSKCFGGKTRGQPGLRMVDNVVGSSA
ncbi:hypothetical protein BCR44DRAFT_1518115 [Catenaria anguillulae PL171]|uniref:Peptidase S9 prolyl oligopeptidase catalytic domain-containing protein n=1 Tax=Catenaria anguillulae PL171 TaxID=765915 RepID=A0A1Y2H5B4_9FUNG|nr:hypothetical protein BCR44DRAFT_1518115 [Catenaria anguillulae PL171]